MEKGHVREPRLKHCPCGRCCEVVGGSRRRELCADQEQRTGANTLGRFTMFSRLIRPSRPAQPAQAVVEFALVLPVLVLMLAGIVDLANGFQTYIALTNAAREGAHWGINNSSGICTRVQSVVSVTLGSCNVYYGANADGSCNTSAMTRTVGQPVCVSVSYPLPTLMGAVLGFDTIPINTYATLIVFSP